VKLLPSRRKTPEARTGSMTVVEHLEELRHRIVICLWAIGLAAVVAWFLYPPVKEFLRAPYCDFTQANPTLSPIAGCNLVFTSPVDAMLVKMKTVFFIALGLALPVLLYQLWAFIVPGLTSREKKWSVPFVLSSFLLFLLGAAVAFWTMPKALGFMLGFAGEGVVPLLSFDKYLSFVFLVTLAFGVSFLLPVLLVFLELVGVVTPQWLAKYRRYAFFVIMLFAAIITPSSDPYSMLGLGIPMYLFYEAAIIIGRLAKRERKAG
jgi:sec-independent protein translocase protein TatC